MMETKDNSQSTSKKVLVEGQDKISPGKPRQLHRSNSTPAYPSDVMYPSYHDTDTQPIDIAFITIEKPVTLNEGLQLIREKREAHATQIILVAIKYRSPQAKVECYLAGADHCITAVNSPSKNETLITDFLNEPEWQRRLSMTLDPLRLLLHNNKEKLELSYQEVQIILALINAEGNILHHHSMAELIDLNINIYGQQVLEKAISRLRNKIKKHCGMNIIHSVRGYGYRLLRGSVGLKCIDNK